ncbi:hypothetical protein [Acetobacter sp.]|uniref:hypothetical protein n=1 Tax=Acetobacter sp. TaxID=440 RepID=UPI0039E968C2
MPKRLKLPRGIAVDFGRSFGLRIDRGAFPTVSLFLARFYALPGGMSGIIARFSSDRTALREALDEIERMRARCAACPHACPSAQPRAIPSSHEDVGS